MDLLTVGDGSAGTAYYIIAMVLTALVFRADWRRRLARLGDDPLSSIATGGGASG
jgi:hypothetical protein